jgi:CTP synthase (UTP-ammonia lyase)
LIGREATDPAPRIAIVGELDERKQTHRATNAELTAAGADCTWVPTGAIGDPARSLGGFNGVVIAPGSPYASLDGALAAIRHARERGMPLVAMCGGFQHVVLELVRNVLGLEDAGHAELSPDVEQLAVTPLTCSLAGQRRVVRIVPGSRAADIYGVERAVEPYFCSYGLNPALEPRLEVAGTRISGRDEDGNARIVELDSHPFFLATLYVFQAREDRRSQHPLTAAFLAAARG